LPVLQAGAAMTFPESFADYAHEQLHQLQYRLMDKKLGDWSWERIQELFALLSVTKGSIPRAALRRLVGSSSLDNLDPRAERWLWRRTLEETGERAKSEMVAFAHPRLAEVFRKVLLRPNFEPDIVADAEERLVAACGDAWTGKGDKHLRSYAFAWLPAHLIALDRSEEVADLLGDGRFILARLSDDPSTAMVRKTASETIGLGPSLAEAHPATAWLRFWAETEGRVLSVLERAEALGLTVERILAQLALDRFGPRRRPSSPLLTRFAPLRRPACG
jgi:hypothetical protein